jgi:hypothetical protein
VVSTVDRTFLECPRREYPGLNTSEEVTRD